MFSQDTISIIFYTSKLDFLNQVVVPQQNKKKKKKKHPPSEVYICMLKELEKLKIIRNE